MKPGLVLNDTYEYTLTVTPAMQAQFNGVVVHELYATGPMIAHMEWAARQHITPYLEPGEEGMGYHVDIRHLAPTPIGATVRIRSTVTEVLPNRVTSAVTAWREIPDQQPVKIGEGHITQALIQLADLRARLAAPPNAEVPPESEPTPDNGIQFRDGETPAAFSLSIQGWESTFPCTRYDEWMVVHLAFVEPDGNTLEHTGPLLLHYELQELLEAFDKLQKGEIQHYESRFLEPALAVSARHSNDYIALKFSLHPEAFPKTHRPSRSAQVSLQVDLATFTQSVTTLTNLLAQFPSRL